MDSSQPYLIIGRKLEFYAKENAILRKQLEDYGRENGELSLLKTELEQQIAKLQFECQKLRENSQSLMSERDEFASKFRSSAMEVTILKKQVLNCNQENEELVASKGKVEKELSRLREEIARAEEEKVRETSRREKEAEKKVNMMEELWKRTKKDVEGLEEKNKKLQRELDNVKAAATERFRGLELQVSNLEREAEKFSLFFKSGRQQDGIADANEHTEGFGTLIQVELNSPLPSFSKSASDLPSFSKSASELPPTSSVIDIDDDDPDNELDLPSNGLKRKLSSSEIPNEGENDGNNSDENRSKHLKDSSYTSVNNLPPKRQCENKS